ncbi:MAG: 50S ribosomal protein L15 [Candidatus Heimdallarchaeota archaeon]|nr:50S ribosomal protein L15 [Candidatus Heimdallarchaeota archaeon]
MTVRREKKVRKQRGSRVYGYGRISGGHRKSGSRGGKGNAGIKDHRRIGRIKQMILDQKGFTTHSTDRKQASINIGQLDEQIELLLAGDYAKKEGSHIKIDLRELGFSKVLGKGIVTNSLHVYADTITPKAEEKIEAAGGKTFSSTSEE